MVFYNIGCWNVKILGNPTEFNVIFCTCLMVDKCSRRSLCARARVCNKNGERLIDFFNQNGLEITNTLFPHKNIHQWIWTHPSQKEGGHVLDYILINKMFKKLMMDIRAYRKAIHSSDHSPVTAKLIMNFHVNKNTKRRMGISKNLIKILWMVILKDYFIKNLIHARKLVQLKRYVVSKIHWNLQLLNVLKNQLRSLKRSGLQKK